MRLRLRWKILLFTVLPIAAMTLVTLAVVNRSISQQVQTNLEHDLERASAVMERLLQARDRELAVAARVIVEDPKFFSVLTIRGSHEDPQLRATVAGVARDFNQITQSDLFEVSDARGNTMASVGGDATDGTSQTAFIRRALAGRRNSGILAQDGAHYQVTVTPVLAENRVVGALLVGSRVGRTLADQLQELTRSEVTFISNAEVTGTTLSHPVDRASVVSLFSGDTPDDARGTGAVFDLRGDSHTYLTLARPLPGTRIEQGQIYVMQRALDTETAFLRTTQTYLVQLGLVALLAALLAGWVISERITSPVQRIVRAAEEMERGNFDYALNVPDRDEIGYLARRFRDMRSHQRAYIQNLREIARAKSEFLSVASHELRTPISVISGFQDLMISGKLGPVTDPQRQGLEAIDRSVNTLQRITEDATRVSQIEGEGLHLEFEICEVFEVIDQAVAEAVADGPQRSVQVLTDTASNVNPLEMDRGRFTQAIANLVRNGIRFTPDGGTVDVQTRDVGTHVEIRVRDTGVGISPDRQVTIFDASHLGHDSLNHHSSSLLAFNSSGLGLGLSIARGVIEAHGGTIRLESKPGKGSVFILRVPRRTAAEVDKAA